MSIVQPTDFQGKYTIANVTESYVSAEVQLSIDDYEPQLLTLLLGADLYALLLAGISASDPIWLDLEAKVKPSIMGYVYYQYQYDNATSTTGTGEVNNSNQNSQGTTPYTKMVTRWNEMVDNNRIVVKFIQDNTTDYGEYYIKTWPYCLPSSQVREIFCYKNQHGL